MWITIQLLRKACAMAWSSSRLFPVTLSPVTTRRRVWLFPTALCIRFISSTVSRRTSTDGFLNMPQHCVVLKASLARSWSCTSSGSDSTLATFSALSMCSGPRSVSHGTGRALSLLSVMRLR